MASISKKLQLRHQMVKLVCLDGETRSFALKKPTSGSRLRLQSGWKRVISGFPVVSKQVAVESLFDFDSKSETVLDTGHGFFGDNIRPLPTVSQCEKQFFAVADFVISCLDG